QAVPPPTRRAFEQVLARHEVIVDRLASLPVTFLHGEFYASNVLVQDMADRLRICPGGWESAPLGPGPVDRAAPSPGQGAAGARGAGRWAEGAGAALARAYEEGLHQAGARLPPGSLPQLLDCCRLQVALQWLGWAPGWSPPAEHAHDWLGEMLAIARRLHP